MDDGEGQRDGTEGEQVVMPWKPTQARRDPTVQRHARWTRTLVMEGPADWIEKSQAGALCDGIHVLGNAHGIPCTIEVTTKNIEVQRVVNPSCTNEELVMSRHTDPDGYEAVHGPGSARDPRQEIPQPPTASADGHVGQYL